MGTLRVLKLVGVAAFLVGGVSLAVGAARGGGSAGGGDACSSYVAEYNTSSSHVRTGLADAGMPVGPLLDNSLQQDVELTRQAASTATGAVRADLTGYAQALERFRVATHTPTQDALLGPGMAFADARDRLAKDCDYTLAEQK